MSNMQLPEPGEGKRGQTGHVGYLLRQAAAAHRLRMERSLADLGVTQPQFAVLTMLAAYPGQSSADLARLAVLTPQTVSVIVANLERDGLLTRRAHDVHGRIKHLDISPQGAALLERCKARVWILEQELMASLDANEEATIRRWLVAVATGKG